MTDQGRHDEMLLRRISKVLGGRTGSEQAKEDKFPGNRLTHVHPENGQYASACMGVSVGSNQKKNRSQTLHKPRSVILSTRRTSN